MLEFQEKRKIRRIIYSKFTLIILIGLMIIVINAVRGVYEKQKLATENLKLTQTNYNNLKAREEILNTEINRLKTVGGTEAEIRERYGLVKPGEEVIIIVDDNDQNTANLSDDKLNPWQKILDWFK